MEHLIYNPSPRALRAEIRHLQVSAGPLQVPDWELYDRLYGECQSVEPRVAWLGHNHYESSYLQNSQGQNQNQPLPMQLMFDEYGRDWDVEAVLDQNDIYAAHPSLRDRDPDVVVSSIAAFIQAWLYLGLLEAICAKPILPSYCVRGGHDDQGRHGHEHQQWLYSRNLGILLETWRRGLDGVEADFRDATLRAARICATTASTILHDLYTRLSARATEQSGPGFSRLLELVVEFEPALSALHEAIVAYSERHLQIEVRSFGPGTTMPFPSRYSQSLIARGWCRFVLASAEATVLPSLLRYIDAAGFDKTTAGHETCTSDGCKRNNVDLATYTQEHDAPDCRCRFVKPKLADVFDILNAGKIPVVQFLEQDNSLQLGAVDPDSSAASYIAFSHVWADGLGSSTEIGFPRCQLTRLDLLAGQRLKHGAWFWIDGLCVPKREPYRGKAIEMMKQTYRYATGVIVLDKGHRRLSQSAPVLEVAWAVFASGWFGRLWTYQEGFLPPWVDLELADGLYDLYGLIQTLYKTYYDGDGSPFPSVFVRDLLAVLQKVRPLDRQAKNRPKPKKLVDTFNALTRRRTSRPDDQLLVLGLLLDVDISGGMRLSGEDRWKHFYLELREIPWTVLFDRRPKLKSPPFRWAPDSWISPGQDVWLHYDEPLAVISNDGLTIELTVLVMYQSRRTSLTTLVLHVDKARYELSRPSTASSPGIESFNTIFVRHFRHEAPYANLQDNSSLLMTAGIGLLALAETAGQAIDYDFSSEWEIRLLMDDEEEIPLDAETVEARWKQTEICFT
ncbi:hypothetical protein A1O3_07178 [Capronia epimyces CBS 606.96]|uniref:Heterokaryon incompatibility domain-containing protein n=1 Tax=Capronia epimyces CBS 606.96 TaxID=1182542 RepID=W9XU97_9EURO|nr:uncharacterized protein A1O3_07178 [Capronia epimyces CBS 606.96]EXJ80890.1 hypothetical protein A1O3_07178 [Capronia epimyces CBS 606.96]